MFFFLYFLLKLDLKNTAKDHNIQPNYLMGDTNCTAGSQRINLHHMWTAMDRATGNWSGKRAIKYLVCNGRGKKPGGIL